MKSLTRTRTIGGSLIVTIPKELVREKSLEEGELIEKIKKDFFGALRDIKPFSRKDRMEDRS
jgi:antitoxin component of MazEF toxin-antitoxin module